MCALLPSIINTSQKLFTMYIIMCHSHLGILYGRPFSQVQIFAKQVKIWVSEIFIFAVGESGTCVLASCMAKS